MLEAELGLVLVVVPTTKSTGMDI